MPEAEVVCENCKKNFKTFPSKVKSGKKNFCSFNCYTQYKKSLMLVIQCDNCRKNFYTSPCQLNMYNKHFCSEKCRKFYRKHKTPDVKCETCGKIFHLRPIYIKENKRHFCSYACKAEFQKHDPFWSERMKGDKNPMWKGDGASRDAGHARARNIFPETVPCIKCGAEKSHRHHIDGNTLNNDPSNIMRLCVLCHNDTHDSMKNLQSWHQNPENKKNFSKMVSRRNKKFNKKMKEHFEKFRKKDGTFGKWQK